MGENLQLTHQVTTERGVPISASQYSVYRSICYFDIFEHPVTEEEIFSFAGEKLSRDEVAAALGVLTDSGIITREREFYSLNPKPSERILKRAELERRFASKQLTIKRYAALIARFPFVESVSISGSCSKGLLDEPGDVDYFIITSPGKVWICRSLLVLFKKLFLFNSKRYFCVNYFIDGGRPEITEQNLFTACEIRTLLPVSNRAAFENFLRANSWTSEHLPNKNGYNDGMMTDVNKPGSLIGGTIEKLLDNRLGQLLGRACRSASLQHWKRKFSMQSGEEFELNFRSGSTVSKHHPNGNQFRVLSELDRKLQHFGVGEL
jgi:hypothetical protein